MSDNAEYLQQLEALLGNNRLRRMLTLAGRIGRASGMIDPFASLDRNELREWHDQVVAVLWAARSGDTGS